MSIKQNISKLLSELSSNPIRIVAVTKFATVAQMIEVHEAGLSDFGENKVQVYTEKFSKLPEKICSEIHWHFIGHIQTNKVKHIVGKFDLLHSVDTLKLAKTISGEAISQNITQNILLEVNITKEASKYGFYKEDITHQFSEIISLNNIKVLGLMTMAPYTSDKELIISCFRELRLLKEELQEVNNYSMPELSMGMSNDYQIAIQEGSTILRLGQKIFT